MRQEVFMTESFNHLFNQFAEKKDSSIYEGSEAFIRLV